MAATARNAAAYLKVLPRAQSSSGHNPFGALMAFTLWGLTLLAVLTGWMLGLDRFWGEQWLQDLHAVLAYALAGCAVLHIIGAVATSRAQHQNLIKAMITGTKSAP